MTNIVRNAAQAAGQVLGITSPQMQVRNRQLLSAALQVPPEVRKFISSRALNTQVSTKAGAQYYSTVRFQFTPSRQGSDIEYRLVRRQLKAFSYGTQEDGNAAGFSKDFVPTQLETNLLNRSDTGGAVVEITGMSFHITATSDMGLVQHVWDNTFADITLDGTNQHMLVGRFDRVPQSGGLYGTGQSRVVVPPLACGIANVSSMTNGMPMRGNMLRLPRIRWNPLSRVDSKFQVRFEIVRDILVRTTPRQEGMGVTAFQPPTQIGELGTYVDLVVYLQTRAIAPRSKQQ
jgi:hypothetical protein